MTEMKEQYRERLAQASFNAERPITGLRVYTSDAQERHAAIAEAVAAQVLRDLMNDMGRSYKYRLGMECLIRFAFKRGIDITTGEAE